MTETEVLIHLRELMSGLEGFHPLVAAEAIAPEHRLVEDLGVDSVALLDVAMGLEARLGVAIDESELVRLGTVGAIASHLAGRA